MRKLTMIIGMCFIIMFFVVQLLDARDWGCQEKGWQYSNFHIHESNKGHKRGKSFWGNYATDPDTASCNCNW